MAKKKAAPVQQDPALEGEFPEQDGKPWDSKRLHLSLGGIDDENGYLTFEIFDDTRFSIYDGPEPVESEWFREEIDIDAARRLRDFLNYAVPK